MENFIDFYRSLSFESFSGAIDQKRLFNRLIEICHYYERIIENSIDGIFITDGQANVVTINRAYEIMAGIRREEIIGMNMRNVEDSKLISQSVTLVALREKMPITMDQFLVRTRKKALVSCNPIINGNGEITMVVSTVRDITELETLRERVMKEKKRAERFEQALEILKEQMKSNSSLVVEDKHMVEIIHKVQKLAKLDTTIMLFGETGVGKDELAKYIHNSSKRASGPFIKVNCGAIVSTLMESELFGYIKGAFTGADKAGKAGMFEEADKGTIFLDEIGEMPLDMQVKLLRVIQEREITRVGGGRPIPVDVRIIAATNKDLRAMVQRNEFREDLYYRLNVVSFFIPSLRERRSDIIPLIHNFTNEFNEKYGTSVRFTAEALYKLTSHAWPGNIRELKNTVERAMVLSNGDTVGPEGISFDQGGEGSSEGIKSLNNLKKMVERIEGRYILEAYQIGGSISKAAQMLNMKRSTFALKLKKVQQGVPAQSKG